MISRSNSLGRFMFVVLLASAASFNASIAFADDDEPISYIGHGAFFDKNGKQIEVTQDFIEQAQAYYRQRLLKSMSSEQATGVDESERRARQTPTSTRQDQLLLQNNILGSMTSKSSDPEVGRIKSKLNALADAMRMQVPNQAQDKAPLAQTPPRKFVPDPAVRDALSRRSSVFSSSTFLSSTTNSGQKYIDECRANGVPIPPPMGKLDPNGKAGWKSLGFIPKNLQFIVGTPAEVRVFVSDTPVGMCFALPRYVDDSLKEIELDGAICLGQASSKVCIWDNQMPATNQDGSESVKGFVFATSDQIPIGVPDTAIDPKGRYQAGGAEIENGTGGVCTSCHAGENPFIIHPKADLGGGLLMGKLNRPPLNLPTFSANRYDPLVGVSWPQNNLSIAEKLVPEACNGCHEKDGPGGRFPLLSKELGQYCDIVRLATERTMPPNSPGSLKDDTTIQAFLARCKNPPNAADADGNP